MTNAGLYHTAKKPKRVNIDRISYLPDDLISLILSLLSTKEAVATSVLSKRWRCLWSLVAVLNFSSRSSRETRRFLGFFRRRVRTLDRSLDVVRLKGKFGCCFGNWVSQLIDCGLRELNISTTGEIPIKIFRHGNISSKTLVFLKLKKFSFNIAMSVQLPCLKILRLEKVRDSRKGSIRQFISGCPAVEDVIISQDDFASTYPAKIKLPQSLFISQALLSLNLGFGVSCDLPSIIHLPCLKILHLDTSNYVENHKFISRLLLECTLLEDLNLSTSGVGEPTQVPDHLFISKTLVSLKLQGQISLHVPPSVDLPNLRILHLRGSISGLDKRLGDFLSGCPVLEEINLRDLHTSNKESSSVCLPTLERLRVALESRHHLVAYELKITAPALKHLEIDCYHYDGEIAWDLPNLQEASISFEHNIPRKLLSTVRNSKVLKLHHHDFEGTSPPPNIDLIPKFRHLKCLAIYNPIGLAYLLPEILESSTRLHELIIFGNVKSDSPSPDVAWSVPRYVPLCLLHSLKAFRMYHFRGLDKETQMVNYIFRNGLVLQRITVSIHTSHVERERRAQEKLSAIPRCSRTSQLVFI